jgi:DNA-binding transcriptional LysR family regulator
MTKLTLDALLVLDAIDRGGTFAAAAKELFRVPSTVSYAVAKLEEDLGVALFLRAGPRVELTAAGRALLADGRELLLAAQRLEHKVRRVARGWEAEFSIAIEGLFSPDLFAAELRAFYEVADSTRLRLIHEALSGSWEALLDRRADLVIGAAGDGPPGGGYVAELIGVLQFTFAVAPSHPLAAVDRPLTREDLLRHRVVSVADSARRLPPRTVGLLVGQDTVTVPGLMDKLRFQVEGLGVGFLPAAWARAAIDAGLLVEKAVVESRPPERLYLAWRSGEQGSALAWWIDRLRKGDLLARLETRCVQSLGRDAAPHGKEC